MYWHGKVENWPNYRELEIALLPAQPFSCELIHPIPTTLPFLLFWFILWFSVLLNCKSKFRIVFRRSVFEVPVVCWYMLSGYWSIKGPVYKNGYMIRGTEVYFANCGRCKPLNWWIMRVSKSRTYFQANFWTPNRCIKPDFADEEWTVSTNYRPFVDEWQIGVREHNTLESRDISESMSSMYATRFWVVQGRYLIIMESSISSTPARGLSAKIGGTERVRDAFMTWNSPSGLSMSDLSDFLCFLFDDEGDSLCGIGGRGRISIWPNFWKVLTCPGLLTYTFSEFSRP